MFDRHVRDRLLASLRLAQHCLLDERNEHGHWTGELSASPLSTATACMALRQVVRQGSNSLELQRLIDGGIRWLIQHQNADGGWGDTLLSLSNISTTMLCHATLHEVHASNGEGNQHNSSDHDPSCEQVLRRAQEYIEQAGGVPAVIRRYGKDRTFSVPILTHCALAGLVSWADIPPLPFELACLPHRFYSTIRLPVVSYALPALIAIGQVRHHFAPSRNLLIRRVRNAARARSLRILASIQPPHGGFLEATPLTSFVTMSLAAMGLQEHSIVRLGIDFLVKSVRADGSWPIDTNLATWVTTLSVHALGEDLSADDGLPILKWLMQQQYRQVHPYTQAAPGGWAWTDLPGGVPDADDTPGAMLAILQLYESAERSQRLTPEQQYVGGPVDQTLARAARWLLDLQNSDGGWPTFCRGWGALPFDRSSPDITAHVLRALVRWSQWSQARVGVPGPAAMHRLYRRTRQAIRRGFGFLEKSQQPDGAWIPLWFGNQHAPDDVNPTYGTSKVLLAYHACEMLHLAPARNGCAWLQRNQNPDGGWGSGPTTPSSVEETALALEALLADIDRKNTRNRLACGVAQTENLTDGGIPVEGDPTSGARSLQRGLNWLLDRVEDGRWIDPAPIGFYFAKLWYFERLYPAIFTVSVLRKAARIIEGSAHEAASSVG